MIRPHPLPVLGWLLFALMLILALGVKAEPPRLHIRASPAAFCPPDPPPRVKLRERPNKWEPDQRTIA